MLRLQGVTKQFESHIVLKDISLDVAQGEILCLLGASGCGKTTLLRCIAGLEEVDEGQILVEGVSVGGTPVNERGFGLMFQDFALFPHLNVFENVAFGLQMQHLSRADVKTRVAEVLALVGLSAFAERSVGSLSGGEQQRVALARSLAPKPRLLMLDEPLGSLDAALREHLVTELSDILKAAGVTAVYVTHDQQEAFAIADRVAVMNQGQIEQVDTPRYIYTRPATLYVAKFLGLHNILPVTKVTPVSSQGEVFYELETALGRFLHGKVGKWLLLHPAFLEFMEYGEMTLRSFRLRVREHIFRGSLLQVRLVAEHSGVELLMNVPLNTLVPEIGKDVYVRYHSDGLIALA